MKHSVALGLALIAVWLLWSGLTVSLSFAGGKVAVEVDWLLVLFGLLSCLGVLLLAHRMKLVDEEGVPLRLGLRLFTYAPWLFWEVVKANVDVAKRVLNPRLPINPCMIKVKAGQKSDLGRVIYANSITLTPGTVSVDIAGDEITVHALTREAAEECARGAMDRRVSRLEGDA